jgi:hypothetical protein
MMKRRSLASMDATKWFHLVGLISAVALGIGFVAALVSVGLSWRINQGQEREVEQIRGAVAEQQERAAIAERKLLELQERVKDRHLAPEKRAQLLKKLSELPKGMVMFFCPQGSVEPCNFAGELSSLFGTAGAGWHVAGMMPREYEGNPTGIFITANMADKALALSVRAALQEAGILDVRFPDWDRASQFKEGELIVFIGFKP